MAPAFQRRGSRSGGESSTALAQLPEEEEGEEDVRAYEVDADREGRKEQAPVVRRGSTRQKAGDESRALRRSHGARLK